jgi:type II secretory pathway component PulM
MIPSFLKALSARDRRALVWGGGIVAAALVFAFVVKPYLRALAETREELTVQRELLARERAVVNDSNRFPAALRRSQSALARRSAPLFAGVDELSATSDLSDHISSAALTNRVLIQGLETRRAEALGDRVVALGVDIRAEGDFEGVLRFLNSLERGEKLITVPALTLTRLDHPVATGVPDTEVLAVTGTMTGYATFLSAERRIADTTPSARIGGR